MDLEKLVEKIQEVQKNLKPEMGMSGLQIIVPFDDWNAIIQYAGVPINESQKP